MERQPCEIYSRIVGYYSPTNTWSDAKKEEFGDRVLFNLKEKNENNEKGTIG